MHNPNALRKTHTVLRRAYRVKRITARGANEMN